MESTQEVKQALSGQGYEITTERSLTVDEILALSPEVLVTEATPSDLSCCGLISQIKASPDLPTLKIVMIVHGGALERARALDLGADDVVSFPFESLEFAAKIRTQFRERQPELELEAKLKDALQRELLAETAVEALSGGSNTRRRFWLIPAILFLARQRFCSARHGHFEPAQSEGYAPTQSGSCPAERRNPATGRAPAARRTGACVADGKRRAGNSRVFESANERDPQKDGSGRRHR